MSSYSTFAVYYDILTQNIDYSKRAEYILSILNNINHKPELCLDLACGTGSLSLELSKRGIDVIGVDGSSLMLSIAQQKAFEQEQDILFVSQKMQNLDLYGTVDTAVCCLDSLNHITDEDILQTAINRVSIFMNIGGVFIFDVNTINKHQVILADQTFVYDSDEVFCVWQNTLEKNNIINIDLDFFEKRGKVYHRFEEHFKERAYSINQLTGMLESSGFDVLNIYDDLTFNSGSDDLEKIVFVSRKVK